MMNGSPIVRGAIVIVLWLLIITAIGCRQREHGTVAKPDTLGRFELVGELVIGGEASGGSEYLLYKPWAVSVDGRGRVYVLDRGNDRVQVFDQQGAFLKTIGREGQAPGELDFATALVVADAKLLVIDMGQRAITAWTLTGQLLHREMTDFFNPVSALKSLGDGSLVGGFAYVDKEKATEEPGSVEMVLVRLDINGQELVRYGEWDAMVEGPVSRRPHPPKIATDGAERVYTSSGRALDLEAMTPEGDRVWRLTASEFLRLDGVRKIGFRDASAIQTLAVDGHGHLYVVGSDDEHAGYPIVVLSDNGKPLAVGRSHLGAFHAMANDRAYIIEQDEKSGEAVVARYRIVEDF